MRLFASDGRVLEAEEAIDQPAAIGLAGEHFGVAAELDLAGTRRIAPRLLERAELGGVIGADAARMRHDAEREILERLPAVARQRLEARPSAHIRGRRPL